MKKLSIVFVFAIVLFLLFAVSTVYLYIYGYVSQCAISTGCTPVEKVINVFPLFVKPHWDIPILILGSVFITFMIIKENRRKMKTTDDVEKIKEN